MSCFYSAPFVNKITKKKQSYFKEDTSVSKIMIINYDFSNNLRDTQIFTISENKSIPPFSPVSFTNLKLSQIKSFTLQNDQADCLRDFYSRNLQRFTIFLFIEFYRFTANASAHRLCVSI